MRGHEIGTIASDVSDLLEETGDRFGILAGPRHQFDADAIRLVFLVAGIGEREERRALDKNVLGAGTDIAADHHDQRRYAGCAVQPSQRVLPFDMADFVGEDAQHCIVVVGEIHEFVGEDDAAVRQREGVRSDAPALAEVEREAFASARRQRSKLFEGGAKLRLTHRDELAIGDQRSVKR